MSAAIHETALTGYTERQCPVPSAFRSIYGLHLATEKRRLRRLYSASICCMTALGAASLWWVAGHRSPPPLPYSPPPAAIAIDLAPEPSQIPAPPLAKPPGPPPLAELEPPVKPPEIMAPPSPAPLPPVAAPKKIKPEPVRHKHPVSPPVVKAISPPVPAQSTADTAPPASNAPPSTLSASAAKGTPSQRNASQTPASWQGAVLARLEQVKRYPAEAQSEHQEGTAMLRFSMDRTGHVLSAMLVHKTGSALLDEETLALVRRAEPLPAPPESIKGAVLTLTVPIEFFMSDR